MKARATVTARFASPAEAEAVARALEPENTGFVDQRVLDAAIVTDASAESTGALLHTLDDYLACLVAGAKAARVAGDRE